MCVVCCIISLYCNFNSKGYFVADEAMSHQEKSCLATYTVERKNNVFETLSVSIGKHKFKTMYIKSIK